MDFGIMTTTEYLIELIAAKRDMRAALLEKGVQTWGGLNIYPEAIGKIKQTVDEIIVPDDLTRFAFSNINNTSTIDTSNLTDGSYMFAHSNIGNLDQLSTSNMVDMSHMFDSAVIDNFGSIDTSNSINMDGMFLDIDTPSLPLLDFSNCRSAVRMLYGARIGRVAGNNPHIGGFKNMKISFSCYYVLNYGTDIGSYLNIVENLYDWDTNVDGLDGRDLLKGMEHWTDLGGWYPYLGISQRFYDLLTTEHIQLLRDKKWRIYVNWVD